MIQIEEKKILSCDWCGSKDKVRSYVMQTKQWDGYDRNEYFDSHIELCKACQIKALALLKKYKPESQDEKSARGAGRCRIHRFSPQTVE